MMMIVMHVAAFGAPACITKPSCCAHAPGVPRGSSITRPVPGAIPLLPRSQMFLGPRMVIVTADPEDARLVMLKSNTRFLQRTLDVGRHPGDITVLDGLVGAKWVAGDVTPAVGVHAAAAAGTVAELRRHVKPVRQLQQSRQRCLWVGACPDSFASGVRGHASCVRARHENVGSHAAVSAS
jgi:hypothetical protein